MTEQNTLRHRLHGMRQQIVGDGCQTCNTEYAINPIDKQWISVKDSLPEKNESVIAWVKDDAEIVYFDGEKFTDYIEELNHRVTHWMRKPCSPSDT